MQHKRKSNKELLFQYSGLAFQLAVAIGIAVYAGLYIDRWIKTGFLLFIWLLPLTVITGMIIKVIRDTSKNKNE